MMHLLLRTISLLASDASSLDSKSYNVSCVFLINQERLMIVRLSSFCPDDYVEQ